MKQKIFVEGTEKERKEGAENFGVALFLLVLSIFGFAYIIEILRDYFSFSKMIETQNTFVLLGFIVVASFFILIIYLVGYIIYYYSNKYKEIEPKTELKKTKSSRRKK